MSKRNTLTELVGNLITSAAKTKDKDSMIVLKSAVDDLKEHVKFISYTEECLILELARLALSDADVFDRFADALDIDNKELLKLQSKLEEITEGVEIDI